MVPRKVLLSRLTMLVLVVSFVISTPAQAETMWTNWTSVALGAN
jgi:hypothetical protein